MIWDWQNILYYDGHCRTGVFGIRGFHEGNGEINWDDELSRACLLKCSEMSWFQERSKAIYQLA